MDDKQQVETGERTAQKDQNSQELAERDYYFPVLVLRPKFEENILSCGRFSLVKRLWQTSVFDLYSLATKHKLNLPNQMMELFLNDCNMEVRVSGTKSIAEAKQVFAAFHIAAYAAQWSPFTAPYICTHSVNDYSGLNTRDSPTLMKDAPEGMKTGFTSVV